MSKVNHSLANVVFTDYDDNSSPYEGLALKLSLSSDVLFLYLGKLSEERGADRFESDPDTGSIGVDAEALYEVLGMMLRRSDRNAHDRLREGTLQADHPSLVTTREAVHMPATRRRA